MPGVERRTRRAPVRKRRGRACSAPLGAGQKSFPWSISVRVSATDADRRPERTVTCRSSDAATNTPDTGAGISRPHGKNDPRSDTCTAQASDGSRRERGEPHLDPLSALWESNT